ncbi:hypothetical protein K493DRAFT_271539 [Basidiobolus meristosporus CBS 931.73]|uniref:Maintenance of mitochondrial morphology protein 1 n=1 Tax=Basidiobolus meristosporus CBS 931.73 TaxID=1314790 RepID=A0A1Y1WWG5_9FUNG|nr:hypothetical protein K493DRAFT_271539 [Basidiobolus meristosporus CBS 931.73]|eukprot:ORX77546.1 hypothetical protein K493DRAFT_271539 [Basidiobolus meristosporus CBS 931.73]
MSSEWGDYLSQAVSQATWSFTKGLLLGQLSILVLVVVCVKYLLLEDPVHGDRISRKSELLKRNKEATEKEKRLHRDSRTFLDAEILAKTAYNATEHPAESCDWLNVLLAQTLSKLRREAQANSRLIRVFDETLNSGVKPNFMGDITLTELSLGTEYPLFKDARIRPSEDGSKMRAEISFEFDDQISLGIDTQILVNWPKAYLAALPVSLVASVAKFNGTLYIEFTENSDKSTYLFVSIQPDFDLQINIKSLLGHHTKVKDLPKLSSLIIGKLRNVFTQELVYPNGKKINLPTFLKAMDTKASGEADSDQESTQNLDPDGVVTPRKVDSSEEDDLVKGEKKVDVSESVKEKLARVVEEVKAA